MDKVKKDRHQAFFVGTWVGLLQAFIGVTVSMRSGPVAGFLLSALAYIVCFNVYKWATQEQKESTDE